MVKIDDIKLADIGFYINLDRRTDRNEHIIKNLDEFKITGVDRYSARCDSETPQLNLVNSNFDLYKKFLNTNAETLLVLEDDCKFLPSLKQDTEEIFENIYNTDWDLFWLGCVNRKQPLFYKNKCYKVSSVSYSQSYIIKRRMAEDILKYFDPNWCHLGIDEMLCLFAYGYDIAKDPFGNNFYNLDQPLDHFKTEYTCLCYEVAFTTQYNSYSDLTWSETNIEDWLHLHHPKSKI
jgi:hypothetical protein